VDCEALVGKFFRLDGEEWEVIEDNAPVDGMFLYGTPTNRGW
jgi:hypothetical protein